MSLRREMKEGMRMEAIGGSVISRGVRWWGYCREADQKVGRGVVGAVVGMGVETVDDGTSGERGKVKERRDSMRAEMSQMKDSGGCIRESVDVT